MSRDQTPEKELHDYYDAIVTYGPPPDSEIDDLVAKIHGGEFGGADIDRATLRQQVRTTTRAILADRAEGSAGSARQKGREHVEAVRGRLGAPQPRITTSEDIRSIVDSISRGI